MMGHFSTGPQTHSHPLDQYWSSQYWSKPIATQWTSRKQAVTTVLVCTATAVVPLDLCTHELERPGDVMRNQLI